MAEAFTLLIIYDMIQRIQSVYLLLAALAAASMYVLPFGSFAVAQDIWEFSAWSIEPAKEGAKEISTWPLAFLVGVLFLVNLAAIFLFKNRKLQNSINRIAMMLYFALPVLAYFYVYLAEGELKVAVQFGFAFIVPAAGLVFTFLAYKAINKDEKLVRSLDRIR